MITLLGGSYCLSRDETRVSYGTVTDCDRLFEGGNLPMSADIHDEQTISETGSDTATNK